MDRGFEIRKPQWWLLVAAVFAALVYFLSQGWRNFSSDYFEVRWEILMVTGVFTWTLLTLCMVIALRIPFVGKLMGGLDKGYRIHKWAGIAALSTIFIHWMTVKSWQWGVEWGLLDSYSAEGIISGIVDRLGFGGNFPLDAISRLGGGVGLFVMAVVVFVALMKRIPYHIFWAIHKLTPIVYIFASLHVLNRMPSEWWLTPAAYLILALTVIGIIGAITSLKQSIGKKRQVKGTIESLSEEVPDVLDLAVVTAGPIPHKPGQFAFINFMGKGHSSHPFSMASHDSRKPRFIIKKLGDSTGILGDIMNPGDEVTIEGPYGTFDFSSEKPFQVWIAGGIGITPFISRLEGLANSIEDERKIDFWYSVKTEEEGRYPFELDELCQKAGVNLHRVVTKRDGRLTPQQIADEVGDITQCSVWFCGPAGFGDALKKNLKELGLKRKDFHSEIFELR